MSAKTEYEAISRAIQTPIECNPTCCSTFSGPCLPPRTSATALVKTSHSALCCTTFEWRRRPDTTKLFHSNSHWPHCSTIWSQYCGRCTARNRKSKSVTHVDLRHNNMGETRAYVWWRGVGDAKSTRREILGFFIFHLGRASLFQVASMWISDFRVSGDKQSRSRFAALS